MYMKISKLMNSGIKKVLAYALCVVIAGGSMGTSVSAESISRTYAASFEKAWERYASSADGKANLTYGFNTRLINEDYAWAKHSKKSHYAAIKNDKGWHTGSGKAAGKTSKIEVTHKGTSVTYYCYY